MAVHSYRDLSEIRVGVQLEGAGSREAGCGANRTGRYDGDPRRAPESFDQRVSRAARDSSAVPDAIRTGNGAGNPRSLRMVTRVDRVPSHRMGDDRQADSRKI